MPYHLVLLFEDKMSKVIPVKDKTRTKINRSESLHQRF